MEEDLTPIWAAEWTFENKKGVRFVVKNIPTKCTNISEAMNSDWQVSRALGYINATKKVKNNLKPISVKLKKQLGFGKKQ
jgi:DNA transposition AAA+ family ATPase